MEKLPRLQKGSAVAVLAPSAGLAAVLPDI